MKIKLLSILLINQMGLFAQNPKLDINLEDLGNKFLKESKTVGFSIGILKNQKTRFYNFGSTEQGKVKKPNQYTNFEIASVTKTFTSYLLAKAVIDGKIHLEDDIHLYLEGQYPNLTKNGTPIRLIHLANTSAGIPEFLPKRIVDFDSANVDKLPELMKKQYGHLSKRDFMDALKLVQLDTVPGSVLKHSNAGAQLLGYIIENIYKMPYREAVRQYILKPLEMKNTHFKISKKMSKEYNENGKQTAALELDYFDSVMGIKSCTSDLLLYIQALLNQQNGLAKILQTRSFSLDLGNNKKVENLASLNNIYSIGLNWQIYQYPDGNTQIWADGTTYGSIAYIAYFPELSAGFILLTNKCDREIYGKMNGLAYNILQELKK